jgi:YSIRK-targeted surface antigen transcriptional regulator
MDTEYLLKTCELLYASYNLPIICFNDRKEVIEFNCSYLGYEKVFRHIADKVTDKSNPSLVSGYAGLYGAIQTTDGKILILVGPFKNKKITDGLLASVIHEHGLDWNELDSLKEFIDSIPRISYSKFLNFICLVHYLINREEISIVDFFNLHINDFKVPEKYTEEIWKQDDFIHGTYNLEQRILSYVRNGDVEGLVAFFRTVANVPTPEGKLADDTLRQSKNIFIGFIALVGKVGAIKGNLDIEQTYQLIDLYTQECERCISVNQVNELRYNAIIDFAQRVADQKHPEAYSNEVYSALQFIKTHTNQPIGVNDVLKHVYKSRSVFMEQFKKETGETIGRYILKAKLQESKQLLAYSDKSIADISNFLYFSSQPHFQRAFKNEYGITPLAYRKKKQK